MALRTDPVLDVDGVRFRGLEVPACRAGIRTARATGPAVAARWRPLARHRPVPLCRHVYPGARVELAADVLHHHRPVAAVGLVARSLQRPPAVALVYAAFT